MHDATKVLLGTTQSNDRAISVVGSSPVTYKAGLAVRRKSDGLLSVTKAHGEWMGISLGKSLSDTLKTAVLRAGLRVPLLLAPGPARGVVTITSYANLVLAGDDTLTIGATTLTFKASASTENEVAAATDNATTAAALVTKINAHSVLSLLYKASRVGAVVTITSLVNETLGEDIDLVYSDEGTATVGLTVDDVTFTGGNEAPDFVTVGAKAYISDGSGKGDDANSGATISDAVYVSGVLTGIEEDGSEVYVALVDLPGGL